MTELPRYPADPLWHRVKDVSERNLFEVKLVRACDLRFSDVIRVGNQWVDVFDIWRQGDNPETTYGDAEYKHGVTYTDFINYALDWSIDTWVVIRWYDRNESNQAESEDQLLKLYRFQLVEVQVPAAVQEGNPLD